MDADNFIDFNLDKAMSNFIKTNLLKKMGTGL
jgi:hypothetical protein